MEDIKDWVLVCDKKYDENGKGYGSDNWQSSYALETLFYTSHPDFMECIYNIIYQINMYFETVTHLIWWNTNIMKHRNVYLHFCVKIVCDPNELLIQKGE